MIKKPDGSYRFCLDFRKLNQLTNRDAYPLPKMDSILDQLRQAIVDCVPRASWW